MKKTIWVAALAACALAARGAVPAGTRQAPKLIHAGWVTPTINELKRNVTQIEQEAPFDGLILHMGVTDVMNPESPMQYNGAMSRSAEAFKAIPFKQYTDNFLGVMIDQHTINWFSDTEWTNLVVNWGVAARLAAEAGFVGLAFDPECYGVYPVTSYWQSSYYLKTDKARRAADYLAAARRRGQEVGQAIFGAYPDIKFFSFYFWSMGADLLGAFCNGLLDVMPPGAAMIDGDEWRGYCAKNEQAYAAMDANLRTGYGMLDPKHTEKHQTQGQLAPAFYLDAYANPENGCLHPTIKQVEPATLFARNLEHAQRYSGGYIWIYGEKGTWWDKGDANKFKPWTVQLPGFRETLFGEPRRNPFLGAAGTRPAPGAQ
jgi:hypothetical protein